MERRWAASTLNQELRPREKKSPQVLLAVRSCPRQKAAQEVKGTPDHQTAARGTRPKAIALTTSAVSELISTSTKHEA